ncbi:MAG: RNA polymerase sigma factor, partial [Saprospiraceae bacterium]|nr:RNA polymerase sigma factor [Saprospiraceae bacterium]
YKVCNLYCKQADSRDDLAQEITLQLWRAFPSYDANYKLSTWMYRIALNVAISFYRQEKRRIQNAMPLENEIFMLASDENEIHEKESTITQLHQYIAQLDDLNKSIMLLLLEEYSYKEIADIVGITESNVATKINRIKQSLKENFKNQ